jgi:microcystin-dependent protein
MSSPPSTPLPVDVTAAALPIGLGGNLQLILNAFADALSMVISPTFLVGLTSLTKLPASSAPTSDIGPWCNGNEWWFWDPNTGQYQPSDQGSPIGTIFMFGGSGLPANGNWLLAYGQAVSRSLYSRLFQAIGETWGPGDGMSTFNLPPPAKLFVNAPGWVGDVSVPTDAKGDGTFYTNQSVNARGGGQSTKLFGAQIPPLQIQIPFLLPAFGGPVDGAYTIPNIQGPGSGAFNKTVYPVQDVNGGDLGVGQAAVPIMPPYVTVNHIIKWQ